MEHIRMECNGINWTTCDQTDEYGYLLCRKKDMCYKYVARLFAWAENSDTETKCNEKSGACKEYCEKYCDNFAEYRRNDLPPPDEPLSVPDNFHIKGGVFTSFDCTSAEKYIKIEDMYKTDYALDQYLSNYIKGNDCTLE